MSDGAERSPSAFDEAASQAASIPAVVLSVSAAAGLYVFASRSWNDVGDAFRIVPVLYVVVVLAAALCVALLATRARLTGDPAAAWVATGIGLAGWAALGQASAIMRLESPPADLSPDGLAALYLIWHAAWVVFVLGGLFAPGARRLRWGLTVVFATAIAAAFADTGSALFPHLVDQQGMFTPLYHRLVVGLVVASAATAALWMLRAGRGPTRPEVWIGLGLVLTTLDITVASGAERLFESIWWSSAALRAAQFALPAMGLLADALRLLGQLRLHERSLTDRLAREREAALRLTASTDVASGDRRTIQAVIDGDGFTTVFQPIFSLRTGQMTAVEALTRFTVEPSRSPDRWFDQAHRCGLGVELELATLAAAIRAGRRRPEGVALSVNLSPATIESAALPDLLDREPADGLIVEITEHAPVEDYPRLLAGLEQLRRRGILIAVDDAGSGIASFQHIIQLRPDVVKLDMSLTRDIDRDPVRRAFATSLVDFARRIDVELIAEGVETTDELDTLTHIGAHAAQGYLLARPGPLPQVDGSEAGLARQRSARP